MATDTDRLNWLDADEYRLRACVDYLQCNTCSVREAIDAVAATDKEPQLWP
jgi:hypothetical protein